jgi:hypothetical protein
VLSGHRHQWLNFLFRFCVCLRGGGGLGYWLVGHPNVLCLLEPKCLMVKTKDKYTVTACKTWSRVAVFQIRVCRKSDVAFSQVSTYHSLHFITRYTLSLVPNHTYRFISSFSLLCSTFCYLHHLVRISMWMPTHWVCMHWKLQLTMVPRQHQNMYVVILLSNIV